MSTVVQGSQTFAIDSAHSSVEFVVRHMVISKVRGRFASLQGSLTLEAGSDIPTSVAVDIATASISTNEEKRDAHLTSPDFLNAQQFPTITFRSTSVTGSKEALAIAGDLTIHGTTKPVQLKASLDGRTTDPWGNDRIAYSAQTTIDRRDFGMVWNQALETGGVLVGTEITIEISVQAIPKG